MPRDIPQPVVLAQIQVQVRHPPGVRGVRDERRRSESRVSLGHRERDGIDHDRAHALGEQLRAAAVERHRRSR